MTAKPAQFTWLEWDRQHHGKSNGRAQEREIRLGEKEYLWLEKGLQGIGLFSKLTLKNLATILPYIRLYAYEKGHVLCREGEPGDRFFIIYKGSIDVLKTGGIFQGSPAKLSKLGPGDFFGEMALLFNQPRSANCVTTSGCELFSLTYEDFSRVLARHPEVLKKLRAVAHQRLKDLSKAWGSKRLI